LPAFVETGRKQDEGFMARQLPCTHPALDALNPVRPARFGQKIL